MNQNQTTILFDSLFILIDAVVAAYLALHSYRSWCGRSVWKKSYVRCDVCVCFDEYIGILEREFFYMCLSTCFIRYYAASLAAKHMSFALFACSIFFRFFYSLVDIISQVSNSLFLGAIFILFAFNMQWNFFRYQYEKYFHCIKQNWI